MNSGNGTVYHEHSSKGWKKGKRVYKNNWCAEIYVDSVRYRHRGKDEDDCREWLKAVKRGRIKPTDNGADWMRMEQRKYEDVRYDEIIVSAAEEAMLMYAYNQTGDLKDIKEYLVTRLLPHMTYYCCHTLKMGQKKSVESVREAGGLLLARISSGKPVTNFTAACKRMLRIRKAHGDFWYYEKLPDDVKMVVNGLDLSHLAGVWKVTRDRRI